MKRMLLVIIAGVLITGTLECFAQKGIPKFSPDSISIISPHVEVTTIKEDIQFSNYELLEKIAASIVSELRMLLPKSKFIDLPLMHKDYLSVNRVMEFHYHLDRTRIPAQLGNEVIVTDCKYSILITLYSNTYYSNAGMMVILINNETKKMDYYNRVEIRPQSGDSLYIRKLLKPMLQKFIALPATSTQEQQ